MAKVYRLEVVLYEEEDGDILDHVDGFEEIVPSFEDRDAAQAFLHRLKDAASTLRRDDADAAHAAKALWVEGGGNLGDE